MMTHNEQLIAANRRARERQMAPAKLEGLVDEKDFPDPEMVAPDSEALSWEWFISTIDPGTRDLLGENDLRELFNQQLKKALDEKKAVARKAATDQAAHAARVALGLIPASMAEEIETQRRNNRLTKMRIELPPSGDQGEIPDIGLRVDGRIYLHGRDYTVTEAQAASMREILFRAGNMELEFKGQSLRLRRWLLSRGPGDVIGSQA